MEINGSFSADVTDYHVKCHKEADGQTATFDVVVGVTKQEATKKFGADFEKLAFGTMYVKKANPEDPKSADVISYLQDKIKPGGNVVFPRHVVTIDGSDPFQEQPQLFAIEPQEGVERVLVTLRIPIDVDRAEKFGIGSKVGQTLTVAFNPQQGQFDFDRAGARGGGHNLGKESGNGNGHADSETAEAQA